MIYIKKLSPLEWLRVKIASFILGDIWRKMVNDDDFKNLMEDKIKEGK